MTPQSLLCVCNMASGRIVWKSNKVVVFQHRSVNNTSLGSVAYCYVFIGSTYALPYPIASLFPYLPSLNFSNMGSSVHMDIFHLPHLIYY